MFWLCLKHVAVTSLTGCWCSQKHPKHLLSLLSSKEKKRNSYKQRKKSSCEVTQETLSANRRSKNNSKLLSPTLTHTWSHHSANPLIPSFVKLDLLLKPQTPKEERLLNILIAVCGSCKHTLPVQLEAKHKNRSKQAKISKHTWQMAEKRLFLNVKPEASH